MAAPEIGELAYSLRGVGWPWQCGRAVVERVVEVIVPHGLGLHDPGLCGFWCVWTAGGSLSPVECCVEGFPRGAFAACEGGGLEEPTVPGPHHHGQHVPWHHTRGPRHIHPAQQVQGTRHPHARVESLALGPSPPKHQHQHIQGDRRAQAPDGGKKNHQRALAHITVHPTAHLPKDFGTERHIVLEGQAHDIITAALYTLAAHEHHWDPKAISGMPPPPQGPSDPVTPFHIDQLSGRRAAPHLHPSRMELGIASWDTLDAPPQQPAVHILKADAQWCGFSGHTESSWQPRATPQKWTRKTPHEADSGEVHGVEQGGSWCSHRG